MSKNRKSLSTRDRFLILQRDGFRCRYCGASPDRDAIHIDHIIPLDKGGPDTAENMITACSKCNLGKGTIAVVPHCDICNTTYNPVKSIPKANLSGDLLVCDTCISSAVNLLHAVTEPGSTFSQCPGCEKLETGARTLNAREPYAYAHICAGCWADMGTRSRPELRPTQSIGEA